MLSGRIQCQRCLQGLCLPAQLHTVPQTLSPKEKRGGAALGTLVFEGYIEKPQSTGTALPLRETGWREESHSSQTILQDKWDWILMHLLSPEPRAHKVDGLESWSVALLIKM